MQIKKRLAVSGKGLKKISMRQLKENKKGTVMIVLEKRPEGVQVLSLCEGIAREPLGAT